MTASDENDDIDQWIEQLAGRHGIHPSSDRPPEGPAEVRVLRKVLALRMARERDALNSAHGLQAGEEHALQRLHFRLKQEGLLKRPLRRRPLWLPAAAAAMLLAALGIQLYPPPSRDVQYAAAYEEPPRYRGGVTQAQVPADKPLEAARQLAAVLDTLGAQPKLYVWQGEVTVDFEVSSETLTALQKELAAYSLPVDAVRTGLNRLVFHAR